jgi:phosphate transport system protein
LRATQKEEAMPRHFDGELKKLKEKIFKMGLLVEKAIENATTALFERDSAKAQGVIKNDQEINVCEIEIDEIGHELIALYQPAAVDLRLITMVLKITNDLERMGDQAVNIAEKALVINQEPPLKPYEDLPMMALEARRMVRDALNAFMESEPEKARSILERDDVIDRLNDKIYEDIQTILAKKPEHIRTGISLIMVSHNLERIADLATNVAEDVIYLKRGIDVRHHIRERREEK